MCIMTELNNKYYIIYNNCYIGRALFLNTDKNNNMYWGVIKNNKLVFWDNENCEVYRETRNIPQSAWNKSDAAIEPVVLNEENYVETQPCLA